jgi:hypothetical protein
MNQDLEDAKAYRLLADKVRREMMAPRVFWDKYKAAVRNKIGTTGQEPDNESLNLLRRNAEMAQSPEELAGYLEGLAEALERRGQGTYPE